jgi:ATP-dependent DNA helicase PIF1
LECVDEVCRQITRVDAPFGGIPFIGVGDFRQVAPVVTGHGPSAAIQASVKTSYLWPLFLTNSLTAPCRSAADPEYTAFVDRIGEDHAHASTSLDIITAVADVPDAIRFLYSYNILAQPHLCLKRAFLTPRNANVDEFNALILQRLPQPERASAAIAATHTMIDHYLTDMYFSADSLKEDESSEQPPDNILDYLTQLTHNGTPPHALRLKKGSICTLMRNMSIRKGLVKNARVAIHELHRRIVDIKLIDPSTGELSDVHSIPRIRFAFTPPRSCWTVNRIQFPLRLAYACTFNSCVGLTLDRAVVDVRTPVFAHGQLYTALSRVRHRDDCRVLYPPERPDLTPNVVYKELLLT